MGQETKNILNKINRSIQALDLNVPVKAIGAEINTGTDDAKFVTPKAIADSGLMFNLLDDLTPQLAGNLDLQTHKIVGEGGSKGIYIDANGKIGIGITTPEHTLDIYGQSANGVVRIFGGDGSESFDHTVITIGYGTTGKYPHFIHTRHNSSGINNAIEFYTCDGTENGVFPTNAVLGLNIENGNVFIHANASATPPKNSDVVIEATNNTTLTFKLKGSDGTVRSGTITLS